MKRLTDIEILIDKINVVPGAEMDQRTLGDALTAHNESRKQQRPKSQPRIGRIIMKSRTTKLAAAAVIVMAVLIGINHFGGSVDMASVTWGDVLDQIKQARTVTFNQTSQSEGGPAFTSKKMIMAPGHLRLVQPDGGVRIWDFNKHKSMYLEPHMKLAIIEQSERTEPSRGTSLYDHLEWIATRHEKEGEFVREEEIDGQLAYIFVIENEYRKTTVWVDPDTNLPLRVEQVQVRFPNGALGPHARIGDKGSTRNRQHTMTSSDFRWNVELDESLFSLEPPEGYTVERRQR